MIDQIQIANTATYTGDPTTVRPLKALNFFFGGNGTGKTTISRVLGTPDKHPNCAIQWKANHELHTLVYNTDFVQTNFVASRELPGVFTLGEEGVSLQKEIEKVKTDLEAIDDKLKQRDATLNGPDNDGGKKKEAEREFERFKELCWSWKSEYDVRFKTAFDGYHSKKKKFAQRLITEHKEATSSSEPMPDLEQLRKLADELFGDKPEKVPLLGQVDGTRLNRLAQGGILRTPVIGKEGVDIGALISRLGNSDWVRQGASYLAESDGQCPFCQQAVPESLEQDLSEFFDDAYDRQLRQLKDLASEYSSAANDVRTKIQDHRASDQKFLDVGRLKEEITRLEQLLDKNERRLQEKIREPSRVVQLEFTNDVVARVNEILEEANNKARQQHQRVDNFQDEKKRLVAKIWRRLAMSKKAEISSHLNNDNDLRKAIDGIEASTSKLQTERADKQRSLIALQRRITSTKPTIDEINKLLQSYGFESFSLAASDDSKGYRLVRPDGHSDAMQSLSEGERSFVSFLYFYHLVDGGHDSSSMVTEPRCVVIDDPVSSLDSDVLFVVSALIRQLARRVLGGDNTLKQLFVLTHNAYFHREVTFRYDKSSEATYWTVHKTQNQTHVEYHDENPVKTTYESLWDELKKARVTRIPSPIVRNVMRRILEYYFKLLGKTNLEDLVSNFSGKDQVICAAMVSWAHAGSHASFDDPSHTRTNEDLARQMDVFRLIFEKTEQIAHYNMMMGE